MSPARVGNARGAVGPGASGARGRRLALALALAAAPALGCATAAGPAAAGTANVAPAVYSIQGEAAPRVLLRRRWTLGATIRSALVIRTTASSSAGAPPVTVTAEMESRQRVLEVQPDGTALIEETQGGISMRAADGRPIPVAPQERLDGVVFRYRVTDRGEVVGLVDAQGATEANQRFVQQVVESIVQSSQRFPEQPVGQGDTWRDERPLVRHTAMGEIHMTSRSTWSVERVELRAGRPVAVLGVRVAIAMTPTVLMGAHVTANGGGRGLVEHDVEAGTPLRALTDTTVVTEASMPPAPVFSLTLRTELDSRTMR